MYFNILFPLPSSPITKCTHGKDVLQRTDAQFGGLTILTPLWEAEKQRGREDEGERRVSFFSRFLSKDPYVIICLR